MLSWARECVNYTEDTLSDKTNNVETCNPGCDQPTKYKCKDGYAYDSKSKSCKAKVEECTYTYTYLDKFALVLGTQKLGKTIMTCGRTGPSCTSPGNVCSNGYRCIPYGNCYNGTQCYNAITENNALYYTTQKTAFEREGQPATDYIEYISSSLYNKIDNTSKTCQKNGTTYYEKVCAGTPKELCPSGKKFTSNGCKSNSYESGFVIGTEYGSCGEITCADRNMYDSIEQCEQATNRVCYPNNKCAQDCESAGYYSTEEACLNSNTITVKPGGSPSGSGTSQGSCSRAGFGYCYEFKVKDFLIRTINNGTVSCHDDQYSNFTTASISVYLLLQSNGKYATDINGKEVRYITQNGNQFSADKAYYLCGAVSNNNIPAYATFYLDGQKFVGPNVDYNNGMYHTDGRGNCKKISFKNGNAYKVSWTIEPRNMSDGKSYTCKLQ